MPPRKRKKTKKKARPPRVHVDKRTGKRYVVVNGKRIRIQSKHKDTAKIIQVIVNNFLRSNRNKAHSRKRNSSLNRRHQDFVKFSLFNLAEALEHGDTHRAKVLQGQLQAVGVATPPLRVSKTKQTPITNPPVRQKVKREKKVKASTRQPKSRPPSFSFLDDFDFTLDPEFFLDVKDEFERIKREKEDDTKEEKVAVVTPPPPSSSLSALPDLPRRPVTRSKTRKASITRGNVPTSSLSTMGKGKRQRRNAQKKYGKLIDPLSLHLMEFNPLHHNDLRFS